MARLRGQFQQLSGSSYSFANTNINSFRTKHSLMQLAALDGTGKTFNVNIFPVGRKTVSRTGKFTLAKCDRLLIIPSYTVLVRRYQNQGIHLPSAASSPSGSSTPATASSYPEDESYLSPAPNMYDDLLSAPSQATSSRHRNSWSSMDNDAYATWSTAQEYDMPVAMTVPEMYHAPPPMPQFSLTQPPTLLSNAPLASDSSHWDTHAMHSALPMHARSPITSTSMQQSPSYYDYHQYPATQQPMMSYDPSYTASTAQPNYNRLPHRSSTSMPRPRTSSQEQQYLTHTSSPAYHDPRYPHHPPYPY